MIEDVNIVGNGVFGTFLAETFRLYNILNRAESDNVILAVPASAYEDVAKRHRNKHLINVCSAQTHTTDILKSYSDRVTAIHPLFGPNSPNFGIYSIVTKNGPYSEDIINFFKNMSGIHYCDSVKHDEIMRKTHLPVLLFGQMAALLVDDAKDIPYYMLTPSFKKLQDLAEQMKDMSEGTVSSIMSNRGNN